MKSDNVPVDKMLQHQHKPKRSDNNHECHSHTKHDVVDVIALLVMLLLMM